MITKQRVRLKRQICQISFILAITLLLSSIGIGSIAAQDSGEWDWKDPRAVKLRDAGLLTELNLSQTFEFEIEGEVQTITATLHWVYADINQVLAGYTVDGLSADTPDPADFDALYVRPEIKLHDADGNELFLGSGGGSDGDRHGDGTMALHGMVGFGFNQFRAVDDPMSVGEDYLATVYGDTLPGALDLIVEVALILTTPSMSIYEEVPDATAEFPVTVPVQPGIELTPLLTETQQDIDVTLESLRISPTQTRATVCYDLPDNRDWQPQFSLVIDDVEGLPMGWGMTQRPTPEDISRCFTVDFSAVLSGDPVQVTLTLERLQLSWPESPEFWEEVRVALIPHGIEIEVNPDPHIPYRIVSAPDGMDEAEQGQLVWSVVHDLLPAVEGPWVFVVPLSE